MDPVHDDFVGDVWLAEGVIRALGPGLAASVPSDIPRVDVRDCIVLPGFVQSHVHSCQSLARGQAEGLTLLPWLSEVIWPYEAALDAERLHEASALAFAELLLGGSTAVLDMATVHDTDAVFTAAERLGIRACIGNALMDEDGPTVPARLRPSTRWCLAEAERLRTRWHGAAGGRLRFAYAPRFALSCTDALLREVAHRAQAEGHLVHIHACEQQEEIAAVQRAKGCDNLTHLQRLGVTAADCVIAHCVWLSPAERRVLQDDQVQVAHCPSSNLKLGSGIAPVTALRAAGVAVSLGADGAPCNNRLDMFMEMRLAALLQSQQCGPGALTARQVVHMATLGGAVALGWHDRIGSLTPGKRADVIVVDRSRPHHQPRHDPYTTLVYASSAADVRHVWVDGSWRVRDGALVGGTGWSTHCER